MKILILFMMLMFPGITEDLGYKHYIAEGSSMAPTILAEDRLTVDPTYYKEHLIERGDIIVFAFPNGNLFIKRIIGLPGDTVKAIDNKLYVNDVIQEEPYIQDEVDRANQSGKTYNLDFAETKVPENSVFVLGDNRPNSADSRMIGPIGIDNIIGKVIKVQHSSNETELKPITISQVYPGNIMCVARIELIDGSSGQRVKIEDKNEIDHFLNEIKDEILTPDDNQEPRVGYIFRIALYEGNELKMDFIPNSINKIYYNPNENLNNILRETFTKKFGKKF